jgi:hypothetical protein
LKGKVKKGEKPDWNAFRGLRSARYVFCILFFNLSSSLLLIVKEGNQ